MKARVASVGLLLFGSGACALIDDRLRLAVAFMDRPRPGEDSGPVQSIELHLAEMPFVDPHGDAGLAIALRRQGIELTGTTIGAVTGRDFGTANQPVDHGILLITPSLL